MRATLLLKLLWRHLSLLRIKVNNFEKKANFEQFYKSIPFPIFSNVLLWGKVRLLLRSQSASGSAASRCTAAAGPRGSCRCSTENFHFSKKSDFFICLQFTLAFSYEWNVFHTFEVMKMSSRWKFLNEIWYFSYFQLVDWLLLLIKQNIG